MSPQISPAAIPDYVTRPSGGALFSPDRRYRYRLWRVWGDGNRRVVFVGLNPSKADERSDDPTIRKCIGFAKRWGYGALDMVNLFALVSTSPRGLLDEPEPIGAENDRVLADVLGFASRVVWAWGDVPTAPLKALLSARVGKWLAFPVSSRAEFFTLGRTASGQPRHPSRLAYATTLEAP